MCSHRPGQEEEAKQVKYMPDIPNNFTYLCPTANRAIYAGGEIRIETVARPTGWGRAKPTRAFVSNGVNAKQSAMRHQ